MIKDKVCKGCKYRGVKSYPQTCDYALRTGKTCLYEERGVVKDRRGNNPNKCNLYEKRGRKNG